MSSVQFSQPVGTSPTGGAYMATDDAQQRHHAAKASAAQFNVASAAAQAPQPATPFIALGTFLINAAVTEPLDRVRFVQQASAAGGTARSGLGFLRGFRVIADREGSLLALWRGLPSSVAMSFTTYFIRGVVSAFVARLGFFSPDATRGQRIAGTLMVGWVSAVIAAPLALGRAAMLQVEAPKDEAAFRARGGTVVGAIRRIVKQRGVAALLTGVPAQMLGLATYMAASMSLSSPSLAVWALGLGAPPELLAAATAPLAGLFALPFDVIRAVQMAAAADDEAGDVPTVAVVVANVVQRHGPLALFTGAAARIASVVVSAVVGRVLVSLAQ